MNEEIILRNCFIVGLKNYIEFLKVKYNIEKEDFNTIKTYLLAIDNEILYAKLESTL